MSIEIIEVEIMKNQRHLKRMEKVCNWLLKYRSLPINEYILMTRFTFSYNYSKKVLQELLSVEFLVLANNKYKLNY